MSEKLAQLEKKGGDSEVYTEDFNGGSWITTVSRTVNGLWDNGYLVLVSGTIGGGTSYDGNYEPVITRNTTNNTTTITVSWGGMGINNSVWRAIVWND